MSDVHCGAERLKELLDIAMTVSLRRAEQALEKMKKPVPIKAGEQDA